MCGRYVTVSKVKQIEKRFQVQAGDPSLYRPNPNVSIGQLAPIISSDKPKELQFFQFGFSPYWAKKQVYLFNARSEGDLNKDNSPQYSGRMGIFEKPMFKQAIRSQRCLVVADAFIEGPTVEKLSKPYLVYKKDRQRPFAMAGIWDLWKDEEKGISIYNFAILTTTANKVLKKIGHHRSPVILSKEDEAHWLDPQLSGADLSRLLHSPSDDLLNAYPISPDIKSQKAQDISLLQPIGQRIFPEYDYEITKEIQLFGMGESRARNRKKEE